MPDIQQIDFNVDLLRALLWQYTSAENLQALVRQKQDWYNENQKLFWESWIRDVFDLRTANEFGLRVWAIILGQPLFFNKGPDNKPTWGFGEYYVNFERGNFSSQTGANFQLSTASARILLRLRYYQLIGTCTVPAINRALKDVFAEYGDVHLADNLDMTQEYIFRFALPSDLVFLFANFDILPRPAGVESSYSVVIEESWGFDEFHENFDNGNFSEL